MINKKIIIFARLKQCRIMRKNTYLCDKVHRDTNIMEYTIIIEQNPETGMYVGQCLQVPAAISQGNTCEELMDNMKDAIDLVLV